MPEDIGDLEMLTEIQLSPANEAFPTGCPTVYIPALKKKTFPLWTVSKNNFLTNEIKLRNMMPTGLFIKLGV